MDIILAKKRSDGKLYRLLGKEAIYDINIDKSRIYDCNDCLDDDEWFYVDNISKRDYKIDIINEVMDTTRFEVIDNIDNVEYTCCYQQERYYMFHVYISEILYKINIYF